MQQDTFVLFVSCLVWILIGGVDCAESPLPQLREQKSDASVGFGYPNLADRQQGFTVQTGYEGYLVPVESMSIKDVIRTAGFFGAIPIIGKYVGRLALKLTLVLAGVVGVVLFGVFATAGVCKFTPFCSFSLDRSFDGESVRSLMSQDNIESAARFLATAVNKFDQLENSVETAQD